MAKVAVTVVFSAAVTTIGSMVVLRYPLQNADASGSLVGRAKARRQPPVWQVAGKVCPGIATTDEMAKIAQRERIDGANMLS